MADGDEAAKGQAPGAGPRLPATGTGILTFGFGLAAGVLVAFTGLGFLDDSATVILVAFLVTLLVVAILGALAVALRRPILRRVFGFAETQIELFAGPLARVAEGAVERDPNRATAAARELVQLSLARYAWLSTRRWIMVSLTALIAAMAALAGTALLFKQNQLLEAQSVLLAEQNDKIREQTVLLSQDVQLAEAARNAALAVEMTQIAALLGAAGEAAAAQRTPPGAPAGERIVEMTPYIDPLRDLDQALILRIVSVSRAVKPYRFLDQGLKPDDDQDKMRVAMARVRGSLPQTYARMADSFGWVEPPAEAALTDRPASPERGQLLRVLTTGGLRNLEVLNYFGLDLAFAQMTDADMVLLTLQGARLSYADFTGSQIVEVDFGGAQLQNARFRRSRIERCSFATVPGDRINPPFKRADIDYRTFAAGADFSGSVLIDTSFAGAYAMAANFDGALLVRPDFAAAAVGAATFRGAVLIAPDFAGADLRSTDLDGAFVFGEDALAVLTAAAAGGGFRPDRYRAEAVALAEVMAVATVYQTLEPEQVAEMTGGAAPYRLRRVAAFEE